jgi:hypothetical protein
MLRTGVVQPRSGKVAAFMPRGAAISVNGGPPTPIVEVAHGFLRDFPDMIVKLERRADRTAFHWTLTGTYAGTGTHPRISGYELWKIGDDGLIAESSGQFDAAEYERQVKHGVDTGRAIDLNGPPGL